MIMLNFCVLRRKTPIQEQLAMNQFPIFLIILICFTALGDSRLYIENDHLLHCTAGAYRSPTERHLAYEKPERIKSFLKYKGADIRHWNFWQVIATQEERGTFGYHAAKQEARIFHDIVKMIFEEILDFEIKRDFYFFRVPLHPALHNYPTAKEFVLQFTPIEDNIPNQRDQILSLNYSLFGNYADDSQSTITYFSRNHSRFRIDYKQTLEYLFEMLGIPFDKIDFLFDAGLAINSFDSGVLYQFFDNSHHGPSKKPAYSLVDTLCYPAFAAGRSDFSLSENLSDLFQHVDAKKFDNDTRQLRLIMNNAITLNPYGPISIRRYDLVAPEVVSEYENELRSRVKQLYHNPVNVRMYKEKLEACWYAQD